MKEHLVFAGGGHSHIHSLANLDKFIEEGLSVTVVNKSRYHYYSGMGPGLLSGYYSVEETRFDVKQIVESNGGSFIEAGIEIIVPAEKKIILSDHSVLHYDIISFNTGSEVVNLPLSGDAGNLYTVKPLENISLIRDRIINSGKNLKIAVIGGGAAGVEIASNLRMLAYENRIGMEINIISRDHLLPGYNESFYNHALNSLERKSINIYEYRNVESVDSDYIIFSSGEKLKYDIAVNASGITPSGIFTKSKMKTGSDGGLLVNRYLQSVECPDIFAGGDCISFEPGILNKVGVYAVKEGVLIFHNLLSYIRGEELKEYKPQKSYLSILNMGFNKGIMFWNGKVISGFIPFYFKYYLDRSFMKKYQKHSINVKKI